MPKWGYAIVLALTAILAAYTFWPSGQPALIAVFPELSTAFTVTGDLGDQVVNKTTVRVAGLERSANKHAIGDFVARAKLLQIPAARAIDQADATAARAYGIDGSKRLVTSDAERSWGEINHIGAVYDPNNRQILLVDAAALRHVTRAAARLDVTTLIDAPQFPETFSVDGAVLQHIGENWVWSQAARPQATGRVATLVRLLAQAQLEHLHETPTTATTEHELRWTDHQQHTQRLRLLSHAGRAWLALDGSPAQALPPAMAEAWRSICMALREDRLCDAPPYEDIQQVSVRRNNAEVLRLERRGQEDSDMQRPWAVVWPDGDEPADRDAGERVDAAVRSLVITGAQAGDLPTDASSPTTTISLLYLHGHRIDITHNATHAASAGWHGAIAAWPAPLDRLRPDTFLDPRPCPLDSARAVKLQRRWIDDASRDEVVSRPPKGTWQRSWPTNAQPADDAAVDRVVRSLCRLRANAVRMRSPGDHLPAASAEIALRIAPLPAKRTGVESEIELIDTVTQERGWTVHRLDSAWIMAEVGGLLTYTVDETAIETLFADIASNRLFPIAPSLVTVIEVDSGQPFRIERRGDDWSIQMDNAWLPADAVAVRRLLRALTTLTATTTSAPPPQQGSKISLISSDNERLAITVGAGHPGGQPVATSRGGRLISDQAAWNQIDLRPATYRRSP